MNKYKLTTVMLLVLLLSGCNEQVQNPQVLQQFPVLIPDYTSVTIPATMAPLNFTLSEDFSRIHAVIRGANGEEIIASGKKDIHIPVQKWQTLLSRNMGDSLLVTVSYKQDDGWKQYQPFPIYISPHPIDYGLVYRRIAPGYELYSHMGIYQRELASFQEKAIIENTLVPGSCVNCHSFKETQPGSMSLHVRGKHGGTILHRDGEKNIINLKTDQTGSAGVYPYWHPTGKYIAYSVNTTRQVFHSTADKRIEVFDLASDLIVYDVDNNRILTTPLLQTENFETFPAFSPDGKTLYFACATKCEMPAQYEDVKYNLCKIDFDPLTATFGNHVDTLINAASMGKSISVPRPSYDGKYLMYTLADYGSFLIWHPEADLWMMNLETGETYPLDAANSPDTDSYHSWSSNSRWFVFSSRRDDGLYTRLYLSSIDDNGQPTKAFMLPQEKASVIDESFYSFNVPEFISGPVELDVRNIEKKILSPDRIKVK